MPPCASGSQHEMCATRSQFLRQGRANPGTRAGDQRPLSTPGAVRHDGNVAPGFKSIQGMVTSSKRGAVSVVFATFQLSRVSFSATSAHRENLTKDHSKGLPPYED